MTTSPRSVSTVTYRGGSVEVESSEDSALLQMSDSLAEIFTRLFFAPCVVRLKLRALPQPANVKPIRRSQEKYVIEVRPDSEVEIRVPVKSFTTLVLMLTGFRSEQMRPDATASLAPLSKIERQILECMMTALKVALVGKSGGDLTGKLVQVEVRCDGYELDFSILHAPSTSGKWDNPHRVAPMTSMPAPKNARLTPEKVLVKGIQRLLINLPKDLLAAALVAEPDPIVATILRWMPLDKAVSVIKLLDHRRAQPLSQLVAERAAPREAFVHIVFRLLTQERLRYRTEQRLAAIRRKYLRGG